MLVPTLQRKINWLTLERREWLVTVALAGLLGFGLGNGHTTQGAVANISDQLGQQKKATVTASKVAGCEHARANIATGVAVQSQNGDDVNLASIPNCPALPKK